MKPCRWSDILHLHTLSVVLGLVPESTKALVPSIIPLLELVVGGGPWSAENNRPVLEHTSLSKCAEAFLLDELVGIDVFSCCFAARHKENMITHEGSWVKKGNKAVDNHREGNAEFVDCLTKGNVRTVHVNEDMAEGGAKQVKR